MIKKTEIALLHARQVGVREIITQKNSRPNHPTTCGKVERFHWAGQRGAATDE